MPEVTRTLKLSITLDSDDLEDDIWSMIVSSAEYGIVLGAKESLYTDIPYSIIINKYEWENVGGTTAEYVAKRILSGDDNG